MADFLVDTRIPEFASALSRWLREFILEKRAAGFLYSHAATFLRRLDRQLAAEESGVELRREAVERYLAFRPGERPRTQLARCSVVRQFALYLSRQGVPAWTPPERLMMVRAGDFVPYIFTRPQLAALFDAADRLPMVMGYPHMPLILRLFYGCGLRLAEVIRLDVQDADPLDGTLNILDTKFGKSRRVPMAPSLSERIQVHRLALRDTRPNAPLFPAKTLRRTKRPARNQIYLAFRGILAAAGIEHGGRGKGPRIHDLRHTFAVHRLESWYSRGDDVNALLPLLVTYLGHGHITGTQYYLRLTPELFPDLIRRMDAYAGSAIPRGDDR